MKFDRLNSYKKLAKQTLKNHKVSQKHVSLGLYTCTHAQHHIKIIKEIAPISPFPENEMVKAFYEQF